MDATLKARQVQAWDDHMFKEFGLKDAMAAVETMTHDATVTCVPTGIHAAGRDAVLAFYRDQFLPTIPPDIKMTPVQRTVGENVVVEELRVAFTHTIAMEWFLPGVAPTGRRIEFDLVVVVGMSDARVAFERLYWDRYTCMKQAGALPST